MASMLQVLLVVHRKLWKWPVCFWTDHFQCYRQMRRADDACFCPQLNVQLHDVMSRSIIPTYIHTVFWVKQLKRMKAVQCWCITKCSKFIFFLFFFFYLNLDLSRKAPLRLQMSFPGESRPPIGDMLSFLSRHCFKLELQPKPTVIWNNIYYTINDVRKGKLHCSHLAGFAFLESICARVCQCAEGVHFTWKNSGQNLPMRNNNNASEVCQYALISLQRVHRGYRVLERVSQF